MILRFFETLVHPAAVPADTGLPRPYTCSPCRATAHMSSMGCQKPKVRLARLAMMQRARSGDAGGLRWDIAAAAHTQKS